MLAQSNVSGDISGTVTDPSGAAVSNAQVTVTNKETGQVKTTVTGNSGDYRVPLLSPGAYRVLITAPGFEGTSMDSAVAAGTIVTADAKLTVGQSSATIEVTGGEYQLLHTEDAQVSTSFSLQQIQNLPNPGNDLTFVAQTTPGAVMNTQSGYGNFSVFGLPATSNTFTLNGGYEGDPYLNVNNSGATNLLLGNNDVDNVTVTTNAYDAAFGGLGGAQVNEISRAGGNRYHGNATYWWNGRAMNANSYFNNQFGAPRNFTNSNQWAAAVGGPIRKDKAFWFINYEGLRVVIPVRGTSFGPSPAYQAAVLGAPNGGTSIYTPYGNLADNGNTSEAGLYQTLFGFYNNAPNFASGSQDPNDPDSWIWNGVGTNFAHEWLLTGRTDFNLSDKDHLYIHFKVDKGLQPTQTSFLDPIFSAQSPQPSYEGQLNETHTFTPEITNQFVFAASYYRAIFINTNAAEAAAAAPFVLVPEGQASGGDWDTAGNSSTWVGGADYAFPQGRNVTGYQFIDDLSWTKGKQTIKVGFTYRRDDVTDYTPSERLYSQGGPENVILDQGDFAAGFSDEYLERFPEKPSDPVALWVGGFYGQDQWKVTQNLTVTAGLRLEHNSNPVCQNNCLSNFSADFPALSGAPTAAYNSLISANRHTTFEDEQKIAWEPRVGIAYQPDPKTTVRAGFGMFADYFPAQVVGDLLSNTPNVNRFTILGAAYGNPIVIDSTSPLSGHAQAVTSNTALKQQFPLGGSYSSISALTAGGFRRPAFISVNQKIFYPTYDEWSLAVEREVAKNVVASVTYVGNHGYHEPVANFPNQYDTVPAGNDGANASLPKALPNQSFASVTNYYSGASSNDNSVVASVVSRNKWLTLQFNYAYSHALDESSNGGFDGFGVNATGQINPYNLSQNYGNSDYDTRHYISGSYVVTIPYWGGPRPLTDGWQVAGTVFHNTGYPFSVQDANGSIVYGNGGGALAQQTDNNFNHHCGGGSHTLTPCDFASHFIPSTDFGQQRRNQLYGPNYTDFDLDLQKSFRIPGWESARFVFGTQFFNAFNHPNFQIPYADVNDGPSTGLIYTTANTPTSILGAFLGGDASPRLIQFKGTFSF
jgi:hypothetical protein